MSNLSSNNSLDLKSLKYTVYWSLEIVKNGEGIQIIENVEDTENVTNAESIVFFEHFEVADVVEDVESIEGLKLNVVTCHI